MSIYKLWSIFRKKGERDEDGKTYISIRSETGNKAL